MQRRNFIKNTALFAIAASTTGFIRFDGSNYTGDCETTTDIIGPFYRPGSPVRSNLVIKGDPGYVTELSGKIKHKDCTSPFKGAKIELWHCNNKGLYDNTSADYNYRGTTFSNERGKYLFKTILPVPYNTGSGFRPAHFHLMITAEGYQPLVTQLYFTGDPYLAKDQFAGSSRAKNRIIPVQTLKDGTKKILYNVGMPDILSLEPAAIDRLTGLYVDVKDKRWTMEFFTRQNELWRKTPVFGERFIYTGNNTFLFPGIQPPAKYSLFFEILPTGSVKLIETTVNQDGKKFEYEFINEK